MQHLGTMQAQACQAKHTSFESAIVCQLQVQLVQILGSKTCCILAEGARVRRFVNQGLFEALMLTSDGLRVARSCSQDAAAMASVTGVPGNMPGVAKKLLGPNRTGEGVCSMCCPTGRSGDGSSRTGVLAAYDPRLPQPQTIHLFLAGTGSKICKFMTGMMSAACSK